VFFVDETTIAELNQEHMGKTGPTDVLAFPVDGADAVVETQGPGALTKGPGRPHPDVDDVPMLLGDVVLCPSVARKQSAGHAGTYDDEVALLLVHGVLHVLGFDHDTPAATAEMRARETVILERHHWRGTAPAGFRQEHDE
jgi:probable rRNA maturation factor